MPVNSSTSLPSAEYVLVPSTGGSTATCTCGAVEDGITTATLRGQRLVRLVHLDRAVAAGQVTVSEASERRVELLAR